MRSLWLLITALVLAGAIVLLLPGRTNTPPKAVPSLSEPLPTPTANDLVTSLIESAEARSPEPLKPTEPKTTTDGATLTDGLDLEIENTTIAPGTITRIKPGELEVDGEWTLEGLGTQESPYLPSWEYLYSAADSYQPRLGENTIPQRIAMLHDKWVKIAGFTAYPLVTGEVTELLVMLNRWDGCCIGVPPTPFDALEVRLTEAISRATSTKKHQITYGTVTGRLQIDPYLIEKWLVGLYVLEESSMNSDL